MRLFQILLIISVALTACRTSEKVGKKKLSEKEQLECTSIFIEATKEKLLGNNSAAGALYAECIRKNPTDDASYFELASLLADEKKYEDALLLAKEAASLNPSNDWYQMLLAELYAQRGSTNEGIKIYEKLIKKHPFKIDYYYELSIMHLYSKEYKEAIRVYNKIEELTGVNEELSIQKKSIYMHMGQIQNALLEIRKLINAFPTEYRYQIILAEIYATIGDKENAFSIYKAIQEEHPEDGRVNLSMADYYRANGETELYYKHIKKAFANENVDSDTKIKILLSYYTVTENPENNELLTQAYELLDILIQTHPYEAIVYSIYADFLSRDGKNKEAREMFLKVVSLDKSRYPVWEQLLLLESELSNYESLDTLSHEALELFPEQPLLYLFNGFASFRLKKYEAAAEAFRNGLVYALFNEDLRGEFYMYLGDTYHILKNHTESDAAYDNALKISPDNVLILNNYSYYLSLRNEKLEKARTMSKKANELKPGVASYEDTYAWVLYQLGKYDIALIWIEKAIKSGGNKNPVIIEHYGDILLRLNRTEEAIEEWKKAIEVGGKAEDINKKINNPEEQQ